MSIVNEMKSTLNVYYLDDGTLAGSVVENGGHCDQAVQQLEDLMATDSSALKNLRLFSEPEASETFSI